MITTRGNNLHALKKTVFYELLGLAGRVFIVTRHSKNVSIGSRGFLPEEKKNGLVLVFNSQMKFAWNDQGIEATLVFGSTPHRCFIPQEDIIAVYSPEFEAQFITTPSGADRKIPSEESFPEDTRHREENGEKVIKIDFGKKRK